ncbi:MAG: hypothetical protein JSR82_03595 [Verrucomicrobia bacterium]|nr:hypothetical protein [Verrucomicrobiota bacterium]
MNRCLYLLLIPTALLAQGPLTPPGAPAPTMKSLDQVEARTPVSGATTISASGSYYLTGNIIVATGTAITIAADNVTLDLNGFTISSTSASISGVGIAVSGGRKSVTVRNGHIRGGTTLSAGVFSGAGFNTGVDANSVANSNIRIEDLQVHGVANAGIDLSLTSTDPRGFVERCVVGVAGSIGIRAGAVRDCVVESAGGDGILAVNVTRSTAQSVGAATGADGIAAFGIVDQCVGLAVAGRGINGGITVSNSFGRSTTNVGLSGTNVLNCRGESTSGIGLSALEVATNCSGESDSGIGLLSPCAQSCQGTSNTGSSGLSANGTATNCRGKRDGGTAISAGVAVSCSVSGTGTVSASSKFLGTP